MATGGNLLALVLLSSGAAQAQDVASLAGTWKRPKGGGTPGDYVYRLAVSEDGGLDGELLNPEEGMACKVKLKLDGSVLKGQVQWEETDSSAKLETRWELKIESPTALSGRCEWKTWEFYKTAPPRVTAFGWEEFSFQRVGRIGLVIEGDDPGDVFGESIKDPKTLVGAWVGPGGIWNVTIADQWIDFVPVGHSLAEKVRVERKRGQLKGGAQLPNSQGCKVELALDESGALVGRSSWQEEGGAEGWSPIKFERVPTIDPANGASAAESPPAAGQVASLVGAWKRDDGLYLRLKDWAGKLQGDLVDRDGNVKARVELQEQGGVYTGRANWDGVEAGWELSLDAAGEVLSGRCEWVQAHQGNVVARGWTARSFKKLRRIM